ncbi:MAG: hypothetical protein E6G22_13840 [Actinobacteria bacterium]|nr:MAG: hypothetical protein E6G22_13840 [Actinomycetota bacterium]
MAAQGGNVASGAHVRHRHTLARLASPRLLAGAAFVVLLGSVSAALAPTARAAPACRFSLRAAALSDSARTDIALTILASAPGCRTPTVLRSLRIRIYSRAGRLRDLRVFRTVRAPGGRATVTLKGLARHERLRLTVLVGRRSLAARALVRLRPDLVFGATTPASVAAATPSTVDVIVAEAGGDFGTTARVVAFLGTTPIGAATVRVPAGRRVRVGVNVTIPTAGQSTVVLRVADTTNRERVTTNNEADLIVEAADFALQPAQVLVPSLAGYGAQLDQNVYAAISREVGVTDQNLPDMEAKVVALQPQFVRIFFNGNAFADPDLMQSFVRTVQLAQRAGAVVNVTWAGGGESDPTGTMAKFAGVLVDLVQKRRLTNVRWVTVENEPNRTRITLTQYEALYRALDSDLTAAGLRNEIRFMGGDLVEAKSPLGQTQADWLSYLATHMGDLLDAYSIHVFWDYWDTAKLVRRLMEVRQIVDALPADERRPLYVSEFSARGIRSLNGTSYPEPGVYADGTPLPDTTINAFQHGWFDVLAARLGYAGTVKWDGYVAKYDRGTQDYSLIGPPGQGWPLRPVYNLTRLFTLTTKPGWKVVGVAGSAGTKLVAGYTGPKRQMTVIGLDTSGASLAAPSQTVVSYSVGGLPPDSSFQLDVWNPDGSGAVAAPTPARSDAAGLVQITAPLQSVFALTTLG